MGRQCCGTFVRVFAEKVQGCQRQENKRCGHMRRVFFANVSSVQKQGWTIVQTRIAHLTCLLLQHNNCALSLREWKRLSFCITTKLLSAQTSPMQARKRKNICNGLPCNTSGLLTIC